MNQQPPQGNPGVPYTPGNMPQGQNPQGYMPPNGQQQFSGQGQPNQPGQQPPYGQQWNAAPNFKPQPNQPGQQQSSKSGKKEQKKKKKKGNGSLFGWILLGIVLMIALGVFGGILGYNTAIIARQAEYKRRSMMAAAEQYTMAISDIEQGKYQNAKTRLDMSSK